MSKRKDMAKGAVEAQFQSLVSLLELYREEFSKTPEDRERLQALADQAKALGRLFEEETRPGASRRRPAQEQ